MPENTWRMRVIALAAASACTAPLLMAHMGAAAAAVPGVTTVSTSTAVTSTTNDAVTSGAGGAFGYSQSWLSSTGKAGKYLGDDHYSSTAGASYTFSFRGTSVQLFGSKAPHHGHATVQIDGGKVVTIDQYASSRQENVLVYSSPSLSDAEHVVKVTVKGSKRREATGTTVAVDRAVARITVPTTPRQRRTTR